MVVLPADHAIKNGEEFLRAIVAGCHVAEMELMSGRLPLITFGIKPLGATSGYGYIRCGDIFAVAGGFLARIVTNFIEKPDPCLAQAFFDEGSWFWNSGIFVWRVSSILREFMDSVPAWRVHIERMLSQGGCGSSVEEFYQAAEPAPIDKLILERSTNVLAIPVSFGWSDVGSWEALDGFLRRNIDENITIGKAAMIDCSGCLAVSHKGFVGVIGMKDVVVVSSGDAVLVIDKKRSQEVETISGWIEKKTI
jgi:mannose-1-phosphate guanylyltransferase